MPSDLRDDVAALPWYHTIELPGGVTTPGFYDLRGIVDKVLPADLSGLRCLDAATASGFWAFEMEKRGASEVVAVDLASPRERDWQLPEEAPTGSIPMVTSFGVAHTALGSAVQRVECSLYDAAPERLGEFDFVFIGSVLLHLRDPVRALRALRTVTSGRLRSYEVNLLWSSLLRPRRPVARLAEQADSRWWTPNAAAHRRWLVAAGFEPVETGSLTFQPFGPPLRTRLSPRAVLHPVRHNLGEHLVGVPSRWIEARPRQVSG